MISETSRRNYEKRIKSLEAEVERLKPYRDVVVLINDWLIAFAGDEDKKGKYPNAAFGFRIIMSRCLK